MKTSTKYKLIVIPVNRPRQTNGDFTPDSCSLCESKSTAYTNFKFADQEDMLICKGCLLDAVELIDRTILMDCKLKGIVRNG